MLKKILALIFFLTISSATTSAAPDSRTTLLCALSSMASYSGETNFLMLSMLKDYGWKIEPIEEKFSKTRVRAFIISNPDENFEILSICGTESQKDVLTDIRFDKTSFDSDSMVHRGFLNYTDELLNLTRDKILTTDKKIIVTGHSLGGAVAILTAARLLDLGLTPDRIEVVTFGAPAVGDKNFAEEFSKRLNLTRFEMDGDPIPKSLDAMKYDHFGERIKIQTRILGDRTPHAISLYLDCAIRNFLDDSQPIESDAKIQIEGVQFDSNYVEWILRDGLSLDSNFRIEERLEVSKLRKDRSSTLRVTLTEFIYDRSGNLLTMHSQSSTTKDLTLIECARFLQEKLRIDRESILDEKGDSR